VHIGLKYGQTGHKGGSRVVKKKITNRTSLRERRWAPKKNWGKKNKTGKTPPKNDNSGTKERLEGRVKTRKTFVNPEGGKQTIYPSIRGLPEGN